MPINKQKITRLIRGLYLLPLADYAKYLIDIKRNWNFNKQFSLEHPDIRWPPLSVAYDAFGTTNRFAYWEGGKLHAQFIGGLIKEHAEDKTLSICEWGCGPSRVLRHLPQIIGLNHQYYGTDYNEDTIRWCRQNIKNIEFELNTLTPPLPYESNTFDCLYCISVFTHLSMEMHFSWMSEVSRVVKPNGLIIFTTHGDACCQGLIDDEIESYKAGKLVVRGNFKEGKRCFVAYHPNNFIYHELLGKLEVISHIADTKQYHLMQDAWVVRNTK